MMRNIKTWFFIISIGFLIGCEQASNTVINIPNVAIECDSAENPQCNGGLSGHHSFVIMTRSGCGDSADFEPVASGSTSLTCDASGCSGLVNMWRDDNSNVVSEILSGRMDICAFIDIDNNANEGSGDLVNHRSQNILSDTPITLDSWSIF